MKSIWNYAHNTFLLLAERSLKRFYKFTYHFMEALHAEAADPKIADIHQSIEPSFLAFKAAYASNKSQTGIRKGDTSQQNALFDKLHKEKMPDWYRKIAVVYPPKTPDFIKIFPQGVTPFDVASFEERLIYLNNIIEILGHYPAFAQIVTEMSLFKEDVALARATQQQSGTEVKAGSDDVKAKAETMAIEMYGALGLLMHLFRMHPENILKFFNLTLLRSHQKANDGSANAYEVLIPAAATKDAGFSFALTGKLLFYNSGETVLRCWFAELPTSPMSANYFDIDADAEMEVIISQYANQNDRFLMIQNLSTTETGSMEIESI